jgi:N6-adenosine-specific RNA methylase IME4
MAVRVAAGVQGSMARRLITSGPFVGLPAGYAHHLIADPAWRYKGYTDDPGNRAPKYKTMTLDEIAALPVADLVCDPCWLMLWTSGPFLDMARYVMRCWGFRYSTIGFTWVKLKREGVGFHRGLGKVTRRNTELVLFGRIGQPPVRERVDELIVEAVREHSRKPEAFYHRAARFCDGPRIELFSRTQRPGIIAWGDQEDSLPLNP